MAIHNYVNLFGIVRTAPQIRIGTYGRTAMVAVTVVRGDRQEDTMLIRTSLKYSSPILVTQDEKLIDEISDWKENDVVYGKFEFEYSESVGYGELFNGIKGDSYLEIIGTKGRIIVPDEWWKASYIEVSLYQEKHIRRYCTNFEGNGFRYLIQVMLQMIDENQFESQRLSVSDSIHITQIINQIDK